MELLTSGRRQDTLLEENVIIGTQFRIEHVKWLQPKLMKKKLKQGHSLQVATNILPLLPIILSQNNKQ